MCSYSEWGALKESGNINKNKGMSHRVQVKEKKGKRLERIAIHKEGKKLETKDRRNKQRPM